MNLRYVPLKVDLHTSVKSLSDAISAQNFHSFQITITRESGNM